MKKSIDINGKKLTLQVNRFAPQANQSVLAQMGETIVLATVVSSNPREGIDYFPLFVEYQEKLYAGGIIKGSRWVKREGKPSEEAVLNARLIDRSIRPLFPKDYKNAVQVVITVLSVDGEHNPDILGICAASAALRLSDIPWNGPVGALRIGLDNKFITNPTYDEQEKSSLDLVVAGTNDSIVMIEAGADEIPEEKLAEALVFAEKTTNQINSAIEEMAKDCALPKQEYAQKENNQKNIKEIEKIVSGKIDDLVKNLVSGKKKEKGRIKETEIIKQEAEEQLPEINGKTIAQTVDSYFKEKIREQILKKGKRIGGRKNDEIRKLSVETSLLPRTHGSALFQRGLTQALTITTLAPPALEQLIESMEGEETKRYIHHYYMPPYSVGETGRFGWPSRREVGHGSLAERALRPMIPSEEDFPYTIRVVSEIMSSNGSTSMASVCGSSLSLMDAGVPIKKAIAGIAMGLIMDKNKKDYTILTDILGIEDHFGDMDFKVAGSKQGVTALQMDVKTIGITSKILEEGLQQAKKARLFILKTMQKVIAQPRKNVSKHAPRISVLNIPEDKIGDLIGPGGKTIRKIIQETEATMDVDDNGKVTISSSNPESLEKAIEWVKGLTREIEAGETFEGEIKRIESFGAFVEILPNRKGLVHISEMADRYVKHPSDIVSIGDKVKVKVKEIDKMGRINLTMLIKEKTHQRK